MDSFSPISLLTLSFFCCICLVQAQQPYVGSRTTNCRNPDTSGSVLGYTCNGNTSCQSYLVFRSQPPYDNVTSIANLLSSDPSQVAEINEVSETATFQTDHLVIVPVTCSCSGNYSQVNTTYTVQSGDDGYLLIANNTFQALSTCQAIQNQQPGIRSENLTIGLRITVPLRCACPTRNQTDVGINYLLSYLVAQGDTVSGISQLFGADAERTLEANQLSVTDTINFFTTLLVPLQDPPSRISVPSPPPASPQPPPPTANPSPGGSSSRTWVYVLVSVLGGGAFIILVCIVIFCRKSKKKPDSIITSSGSFEAAEKLSKKKLDEESQDFFDSISSVAQSLNLKLYKFEELQLATDDFSTSNLIKGSVFRGVIQGDFAAIKKVHGDVTKEIELLNKVNHSNLIRLSGVCSNDGHWYLVYEYAANGALSDWIFNTDKSSSGKYLSWKQKIQIAIDVATGLDYLHSFTSPPHVHKDLKTSNVLIDGDFRAKISNFAQARSTGGGDGQFNLTRHIVGTMGYMAPEYLENGLISTKLDVYAFGVFLLEVITEKGVASFYGSEEHMNLSDILTDVLNEKDGNEGLKRLIEPFMLEKYPSELAIIVVTLINSCLQKNPTARPAMDEIVRSLSRILSISSTYDSSSNMSWSQTSQSH